MNTDHAKKIADLFDAAYDEIDMEGWARSESQFLEGPCCVMHALVRAATERQTGVLDECLRILRGEIGSDHIAHWNDTRKHELEVLFVLEQLAGRYRWVARQ